MPGESDGHTETESEDGGVALSKFGSDEMDLDDESAPTSASQSPLQSLEEYGDTSGTPAHEFFESASSIATPPVHWQAMEANYNMHISPGGAPTLPTDGSFAEALLGSVGLIPGDFNFHGEEDALDPANPYHQPFGTQQAFSHSLVDAPVTPDADEEQTSSVVPAEGTSSTQHHMLGASDPASANIGGQYPGPIMALPSLNDVFGSDFLSQSAPAAEVAAIIPIDEYPADYWEPTEDNMKNFRCDEFFNFWKQKYANGTADYPPISDLASNLSKVQRPSKMSVGDLDHEQCDFQGIYWSRFQTTKKEAREVRRMTYRNHRNVLPPDQPFGTRAFKANFHPNVIPSSETYFRFQEMNMKTRPYTAHFQLRHNLAASSKNALFYSQTALDDNDDDESDLELDFGRKVMCFNSEANTVECAMDLTKPTDKASPRLEKLTTLAASDGVLVAGGLEGVYAIKSLSTTFETKPITGVITDDHDGSTNHVQTILDRRSGLPQAVFDSNDNTIRILDCLTDKFVHTHHFTFKVNCSDTSPDGRLRLLVGDACHPIVADAETGEKLARLPDHEDFGFSCAWAPDGITMATGHQDGLVQVWDARKLTKSIQTLPMEMGGCRAMAFSPAGSGRRVLVLAEPADFVHVVDAQSFQSKQEIEFFGEIAGISMPPDGSRLYIANCDPKFGGIMEFDRCWSGAHYANDHRRRFRCRDEEQLNMMYRIMHLDYGNSINDRKHFDVLDRRRDEFKVGRSEATDWLPDDELETEGRMGPWGPRLRPDMGFGDLLV